MPLSHWPIGANLSHCEQIAQAERTQNENRELARKGGEVEGNIGIVHSACEVSSGSESKKRGKRAVDGRSSQEGYRLA